MHNLAIKHKIEFARDVVSGLFLPNRGIKVVGSFSAEAIMPNGQIRWRQPRFNAVCNLGFNAMLNAMFRNGTDTLYPNWYIGLVSNTSFTSLNAADTMASHSGWTEDSTHYTAANRPAWTAGTAASKSMTNSSSVNFAMNTDNTIIVGIFVASDNTLAGTSGLLWASGAFSANQTLFNGDTLKITYTVTLS